LDFLKPEFCDFCVIIPVLLPFTLWAALRAFKNFPEIFVAAKSDPAFSPVICNGFRAKSEESTISYTPIYSLHFLSE